MWGMSPISDYSPELETLTKYNFWLSEDAINRDQ